MVVCARACRVTLGDQHVAELVEAHTHIAPQAGGRGVSRREAFSDVQALLIARARSGEVALGDQHIAELIKAHTDIVL